MIAFFITMPTSRMQAIDAIRVNWNPVTRSASSAPNSAEGRVDRMVNGCAKLS